MPGKRVDPIIIEEDPPVSIFRTEGSEYWYAQYNHPLRGQQRPSLRTTKVKEARLRARKIVRDLEAGAMSQERVHAATIADAAEAHLAWLGQRETSPNTLDIYQRCYRQLVHWGKAQGITTLEHLTTAHLEQFDTALREARILLPPGPGDKRQKKKARRNVAKTVKMKLKVVRGLIRWAIKRNLVAADPSPHYQLPVATSPERIIFTADQLRLILEEPDPDLHDVWTCYARTGLRASELCWLLKDDVTTSPWSLKIRKKKCPQTGREWKPKHGRERVVPVTDPALIAVLERALATSPGPWLFVADPALGTQGARWLSPQLLGHLKKRLAAVGIPHGVLHSFRHTFASFLANSPQVSITQVKEVLGHADLKTTMTYIHTNTTDITKSFTRVDFNQMTATTPAKDPK